MKRSVAIVHYEPGAKSVERAISLCQGAENLKPYNKVMIKPNVVIGGKLYKSFVKGVVTNAGVLEEIIQFLKDYGCRDISIGEGSVLLPELGATTEAAFHTAGIAEVAERHNVKLVDFYQHPFETVELGGKKVEIAVPVLEADYLINVPVLKTHYQTKVSLCLKNLKGALSFQSKKNFHKFGINRYIALLGSYIKPQLHIVDGVYTVKNGPVSPDWKEAGILLAGTDPLALDAVGTRILGLNPAEVEYLVEYAAITGGSLDIESIDIKGESLENIHLETPWDSHWGVEILKQFDISGPIVSISRQMTCSSCALGVSRALYMVFREMPKQTFTPMEFCVGPVKSVSEFKHAVLLGKCAIGNNEHLSAALKVKGCPPNVNDVYSIVKEFLTSVLAEEGNIQP